MQFKISVIPHALQFKFDARTSRGALTEHKVYYLKVWSNHDPTIHGIGECAPLKGLSIDYRPDLDTKLQEVSKLINSGEVALGFEKPLPDALELAEWPALRFAMETALLDLKCGGRRILFRNEFTKGEAGIPINGLIWMGDKSFMQKQIKAKLSAGYTCLKLKIGGLDFDAELDILKQIRQIAGANELIIRVDANGAFETADALNKLEKLSEYKIHSIEQPIRQGQHLEMAELCAQSPVPIALDEELIGVEASNSKDELLQTIKPQFVILKPTLIGGFEESDAWIVAAEKAGAGWWLTSALESNIGLNAISQFTANYKTEIPQGLGTGQLYFNNIHSPLSIERGKLWYRRKQDWHEPEGLQLF